MTETRHQVANYRDKIEISDHIKRPEAKKEQKDRTPEAHISRKSGSYTKAPIRASFANDSKALIFGKSIDIKDVEYFNCHKKGYSANKCPDAKGKDGKGFFEVRQLEDPSVEKIEEKS